MSSWHVSVILNMFLNILKKLMWEGRLFGKMRYHGTAIDHIVPSIQLRKLHFLTRLSNKYVSLLFRLCLLLLHYDKCILLIFVQTKLRNIVALCTEYTHVMSLINLTLSYHLFIVSTGRWWCQNCFVAVVMQFVYRPVNMIG